jgi:transposase-like protein
MDEISQVKDEYRRQRWAELIRQRQESGMTVVSFCETNGLNPKTYYYWLRKLREEMCRQSVVAIAAQGNPEETLDISGVRLRVGDLVVEIESVASAKTIEAVIRALRGSC